MKALEGMIRDSIDNDRDMMFLGELLLTKRVFMDEVLYKYDIGDKNGEQLIEYVDEEFTEYKIECSKLDFLTYFYLRHNETTNESVSREIIMENAIWFAPLERRHTSILVLFNK